MKKAIIIANGELPEKSHIKTFQKKGFKKIICADGGANSARKLNIIPDVIIGDLDSISNENLQFYKNHSKIIKLTRQNDTDIEKALKFLIRADTEKVILLGATGDRLDHSFCNLGIVLKFFDRINISILHKKSFLKAYTGSVKLKTEKEETISLYGIDNKTKITSKGLKYRLINSALPFGVKESTSNVAVSDTVDLEIRGGIIFVIRDFEKLVKNDLL